MIDRMPRIASPTFVLVGAAFLAACTIAAPHVHPLIPRSSSSAQRQEPERSQRLLRVEAPPKEPPVVSIQGAGIPELSREWYSTVTRTMQKHYPASINEIANLPSSRISGRSTAVVVHSLIHPARLEAKFFDKIEAGAPLGEDHSVICIDRCGQPTGSGSLRIRIAVPATPKLVVLMLYYALPLDANAPWITRTAPAYDYASYGLLARS